MSGLLDHLGGHYRQKVIDAGFSAADVDAVAEGAAESASNPQHFKLLMGDHRHAVTLLRYIQSLRAELDGADLSHAEWLERGYRLHRLEMGAANTALDGAYLSARNKGYSRGPRKHDSVGRRAIQFVCDQVRKPSLDEFRRFIGTDRELIGADLHIEVTDLMDDGCEFEFFDNESSERQTLKADTIRRHIRRISAASQDVRTRTP